jgi:HAD superfamily hydrolase (TIGR01484 family)
MKRVGSYSIWSRLLHRKKRRLSQRWFKLQTIVDSKKRKLGGELIEDRESQITFSGLGQNAPIGAKKNWDPEFIKREKIKLVLDHLLPEFSVHMGGATSIDVTKHGVDKGYGIRKLCETFGITVNEMIFVGDAIFPGGNDYPAKEAGVESIQVKDPHETKCVIETMIACLTNVSDGSSTAKGVL